MTSLFQVIAHEDANNQAKPRQAMALALAHVEDRFGTFVRKGSVDDQAARFSLVAEDINEVVIAACLQVGHNDSTAVYKAIANNFVTDDATPQLRTASVRHEARKPKMCPYHSEVTDISLAAGDPQAGYNAMASHAWSDKHCQGGEYEGDRCKFKPAMVTQAYWDDKAEKAQQRRDERAEQIQTEEFVEPEVTEITEDETPEVETAEPVEPIEHDEPSAIGEGIEEIPMSMAAMIKEAPGKEHMKGVSEKRNRQYEHIKEQCLADGGSEEHCKEMAARTVNKQRAEKGETKSHIAADTAVPKMDKRKWTPKTIPALSADDADGRNPTRQQDITEPIKEDQGSRFEPSELSDIGEQVTERQDVTQKGGPAKTDQGGSFGGGERSAVSSLLSEDAVRKALAKIKRA